jgi:hypothetical protein
MRLPQRERRTYNLIGNRRLFVTFTANRLGSCAGSTEIRVSICPQGRVRLAPLTELPCSGFRNPFGWRRAARLLESLRKLYSQIGLIQRRTL